LAEPRAYCVRIRYWPEKAQLSHRLGWTKSLLGPDSVLTRKGPVEPSLRSLLYSLTIIFQSRLVSTSAWNPNIQLRGFLIAVLNLFSFKDDSTWFFDWRKWG
jgi:hypothetical protein